MGGSEDKLVGGASQGAELVGAKGVEPLAIAEADAVSGGGGEAGGDVEAGVAAKDHASGIHQIEIGTAAADLNQAIDQRGIAAGNPPENVLQLGVGKEVSDFIRAEAKFLEAVEEVGSVARKATAVDVVALAVDMDLGAGAIGGGDDGLGDCAGRQDGKGE